ncbi:MAG TPA: hypothetical protein VNA25_11305 [Phycisphaerae bacterium]|nr:hypothetical protein [Phycisphaerae bacterium]
MQHSPCNPDTDGPSSDLLDAFCRHVIGLSWLDAKIEPDGPADNVDACDPKVFAVSAFVISVCDIWFLVTAGHILRDLDDRIRAGRRIVNSRLIDGFTSEESFPPIPFTLGDTPQWYVYDDGLDYALIPLRPSFVHQLKAGGVSALGEDAWIDVPDSVDGYFLLGFPSQAADITVTSDGERRNVNVGLGTPLLPIRHVDDLPEGLKCSAERFYARVPVTTGNVVGKTVTLTDIDGMSGGPIFAVKHSGESGFRYWVVAVQSGWVKESRVLAACPIQPLVDAILKNINAHDDELDGHAVDTDG